MNITELLEILEMHATKDDAIKSALIKIKEIHAEAKVTQAHKTDRMVEFPGRSGWRIWVEVKSELFGVYERPIEVDGETLESKIVPYYL